MSQPTNTHSTYDAKGIREDLTNFIYDISPTATPVLNFLPRTKASNTLHEWQTHSLTAASANNTVIEGDDATTDAATVTTRLTNQTQISDKVAQVTHTMQAVKTAGREDEMAFQMRARMKELKRDMESSLTANKAKVAGNDSTARVLAGLQSWIKTNIDKASDGTAAAGDGTDTYSDGTARALTEDMFLNAMQKCFENGGQPSLGIVGAFNKRKVSTFSGGANKNVDAAEKRLISSVKVIETDFGDVKFIPDLFSQSDVMYLLDPEFAAVAYLRDFDTYDLAKTGATIRKAIEVEYTLEVRNEKAHGGVYDLTTS